MGMEQNIGHYPFTEGEEPTVVHWEFGRALDRLLAGPLFEGTNRSKISDTLSRFFAGAERLFAPEAMARANNEEGANLYYHNVSHAVHQVTYDGVTTLTALLCRRDNLSAYLTREGVFGVLVGLMYHDSGYVYKTSPGENYAARTPFHVEESVNALKDALKKIRIPAFLNRRRVEELATLAIEATKFPYTQDQERVARVKLQEMDPKERKEAQIVRLAARLADLGGQTARRDYFSRHLPNLRAEMNCFQDGLGTGLIGDDEEISQKCREFLESVVENEVGKIASAFFKTPNNPYQILWKKQGIQRAQN